MAISIGELPFITGLQFGERNCHWPAAMAVTRAAHRDPEKPMDFCYCGPQQMQKKTQANVVQLGYPICGRDFQYMDVTSLKPLIPNNLERSMSSSYIE